MSNIIIITVPADGLAPNGARPSAGTVMAKGPICMYRTSTQLSPWTKWPPFYRQHFHVHFHE